MVKEGTAMGGGDVGVSTGLLVLQPTLDVRLDQAKTFRAAREVAINTTPPIKRVRLPSLSTRQREITVAPTFSVPSPTVARDAKVESQNPTASNTSMA